MKKIIISAFSILFCLNVNAQSLSELFDNKEYKKVIENYKNTTDSKELFYLALSYYQLENDKLNISTMKQSIANGNTNPKCYHYISNSFTYLNQADSSIKYLKIGSQAYPTDIETWDLLASAHLKNNSIDEAISIYKKINTDFPSVHNGYMGLANYYAEMKSYSEAINNFDIALQNCPKDNSDYLTLLFNAGLCTQLNKNYDKSEKLFNEYVELDKTDFHAKAKLIQVCQASGKDYNDKIKTLKQEIYQASKDNSLPENMQKMFCFVQFNYQNYKIEAYEYLIDPSENLKIKHKLFIMNSEGKDVMTVQTEYNSLSAKDGVPLLLCSKDNNTHSTYPLGYTFDVNYNSLIEATKNIISKKLKPTATSTPVK